MPILFLRNSTSLRTTSATWPRLTATGGRTALLCLNRLNSETAKAPPVRGERRTGVRMVEQDGDGGDTDAMILVGESKLG